MNLVADKDFTAALGKEGAAAALPSDRWIDFPFSTLSHHGAACCDIARVWVIANDFAQLNGGERSMGPRWMRERYEWGPSVWPLHWCEAVGSKVIDCGAHAALAHEAFVARGLTAYRAQFVQRYSRDATDQWRRRWAGGEASDHWLGDDLIYHEGNALRMDGRDVKLWDGSAGWWLNPRQSGGYGGVVSIRIFAPDEVEPLHWGEHRIVPNSWYESDGPIDAPAIAADQRSAFFRK
jgi:hypothetical protein